MDRLPKEITEEMQVLTTNDARHLVDMYYSVQGYRIRAKNQLRGAEQERDDEPPLIVGWVFGHFASLEVRIRGALNTYAKSDPVGRWSLDVCGVGPVIAAGLLAHIDITKAPTVGHIWRFAGLDPTCKWEKKTKRPFNARLKVICWHAGESFVKVKNRDGDRYGAVYAERKALEEQRNAERAFADQAADILKTKKIGKDTIAYAHYSEGRLPPAHIHARAKRYAVKLFLSHWHAEAYREHHGEEPPLPYPIARLNHAHAV